MAIRDFCMQVKNVTTSNLDNICFSLHFNLVSSLNKIFVNFLINLRGKILLFKKFRGQSVPF